MKKLFLFVLMFLMTFSLVGCFNDSSETTLEDKKTPTPEVLEPDKTLEVEESIEETPEVTPEVKPVVSFKDFLEEHKLTKESLDKAIPLPPISDLPKPDLNLDLSLANLNFNKVLKLDLDGLGENYFFKEGTDFYVVTDNTPLKIDLTKVDNAIMEDLDRFIGEIPQLTNLDLNEGLPQISKFSQLIELIINKLNESIGLTNPLTLDDFLNCINFTYEDFEALENNYYRLKRASLLTHLADLLGKLNPDFTKEALDEMIGANNTVEFGLYYVGSQVTGLKIDLHEKDSNNPSVSLFRFYLDFKLSVEGLNGQLILKLPYSEHHVNPDGESFDVDSLVISANLNLSPLNQSLMVLVKKIALETDSEGKLNEANKTLTTVKVENNSKNGFKLEVLSDDNLLDEAKDPLKFTFKVRKNVLNAYEGLINFKVQGQTLIDGFFNIGDNGEGINAYYLNIQIVNTSIVADLKELDPNHVTFNLEVKEINPETSDETTMVDIKSDVKRTLDDIIFDASVYEAGYGNRIVNIKGSLSKNLVDVLVSISFIESKDVITTPLTYHLVLDLAKLEAKFITTDTTSGDEVTTTFVASLNEKTILPKELDLTQALDITQSTIASVRGNLYGDNELNNLAFEFALNIDKVINSYFNANETDFVFEQGNLRLTVLKNNLEYKFETVDGSSVLAVSKEEVKAFFEALTKRKFEHNLEILENGQIKVTSDTISMSVYYFSILPASVSNLYKPVEKPVA